MYTSELDGDRHCVSLPTTDISYIDTSPEDRTATPSLFIHGVGVNSLLWRNTVMRLRSTKRCIAIDLPLHGKSGCANDQDFSLNGLALVLEQFCDALGLNRIDLVGNDSGGAIAQVFAIRRPDLLRSFTLTNCDVHSNLPPDSFNETVQRARDGKMWETAQQMFSNSEIMRSMSEVAKGYAHPEKIDVSLYHSYLKPVLGTRDRCKLFERMLISLRAEDLMAIEPKLRALDVPTLIVWGDDDPFFSLDWATWLQKRLPDVRNLVVIEGGRLFFPDERADEFAPVLSQFWNDLGP